MYKILLFFLFLQMDHQALRSPPWMTSMVHLRLSITTALRPKLQGREQWLWLQGPLSGDGAQSSVICPSSRARVRDKKQRQVAVLKIFWQPYLVYIYIYIFDFFFSHFIFCVKFFLFFTSMNELYFIMSYFLYCDWITIVNYTVTRIFFSDISSQLNCELYMSVSDVCPVLPFSYLKALQKNV